MERGKVLVVDDQTIVRETIADILVHEGYSVTSTGSGEQALEMMRKEKFDILLSDIKMPGMNGLDLIEKVHQNYPDVIAILLTAYPSIDSIDQAIIRLGAFDYLLKPVRREQLCETVAKAMERKKTLKAFDF